MGKEMKPSRDNDFSYITVVCDASYRNDAGGVGIQICKDNRLYKPRKFDFKAKGPQHSELIGIGLALKEVKKLAGDNKVVCVICDSQFAIDICNGTKKGQKWYIKEAYQEIYDITQEFQGVIFLSMKSRHSKKVDRWSKGARKAREMKIDERIATRFFELQKTFEKGEKIPIIEEGTMYYAVSGSNSDNRYEVSLDPPSCECAWFCKRWEKVPNVGKYLHRLPCKHICALAIFLNREIELYRYV